MGGNCPYSTREAFDELVTLNNMLSISPDRPEFSDQCPRNVMEAFEIASTDGGPAAFFPKHNARHLSLERGVHFDIRASELSLDAITCDHGLTRAFQALVLAIRIGYQTSDGARPSQRAIITTMFPEFCTDTTSRMRNPQFHGNDLHQRSVMLAHHPMSGEVLGFVLDSDSDLHSIRCSLNDGHKVSGTILSYEAPKNPVEAQRPDFAHAYWSALDEEILDALLSGSAGQLF